MASANPTGAGSGEGLSPGDRVGGGRYILKRSLGRGSTTEVWLAQEVTASRPVALKIFPRAFLSDANLVEKFKQQAQRLRLLKHPHLAMTYELVSDANTLALATEYVDGWSLASLKVDKLCNCYRVEEIEGWIGQLCEALEFAHTDVGIIHSDLKPANLLINAQDVLKVTDFEVAALIRKESSRRGLSKGLYGGLGFLSPQQVMGDEPTKLDDIYSLGATIFDLLTGTPPFYKGEVFAQICSLKAPDMTTRIKELEIQDDPVSPVWENTVARCLAKNPADRPQSVAEVRQLLKREPMGSPPEVIAVVPAVTPVVVKAEEPEIPPPASPPEVVQKIEPVVGLPPLAKAPAGVPPLAMPPARSQLPLIIGGFVILIAVLCAAGVIGYSSLKHDVTAAVHPAGGMNSAVVLAPGTPGSVDASFNIGDGADGQVHGITLEPDGKILVVGRFGTFNGSAHKNIVRLNPDGSLDQSFTHQGFSTIYSAVVAGDGSIYIVGEAMIKGRPRNHILRLDADGGVDKSFSQAPKVTPGIRTLVVQSDGGAIVGGNFTSLNNKPQQGVMRFDSDGKPDDDFDGNVSANAPVWTLVAQPDGKILAGGAFNSFNNTAAGHIVRLNANGTLDASFHTGSGADGVILAMAVQSDGAVVIAGEFINVNGQPCPHVARLNADGTVDVSFAIGTGADKNVRSLALQPDGKIIVAGDFIDFENVPCHHIARLNPDGSLDKSFNTGSGANSFINCVVLQPDGKILLGGSLTGFNGAVCYGLVRLNNAMTGH